MLLQLHAPAPSVPPSSLTILGAGQKHSAESPFFFPYGISSTALKSTCGCNKDFCHAHLGWIYLWYLYFVGHVSGNAGRPLIAAGKFQASGLLFYPKGQHSNNSALGVLLDQIFFLHFSIQPCFDRIWWKIFKLFIKEKYHSDFTLILLLSCQWQNINIPSLS